MLQTVLTTDRKSLREPLPTCSMSAIVALTIKTSLSLSLALLYLLCTVRAQIENVWYVKPTENSTCSFTPCFTLDDYTASPEAIRTVFRSNTALVFLSGVHQLSATGFISIRDVNDLYFVGSEDFTRGAVGSLEPLTRIQCTNLSGLVFINVRGLNFANLTMYSCGFEITDELAAEALVIQTSAVHFTGVGQKAALFLINVHNLTMLTCSIQNSRGYGLLGLNVLGNSLIARSTFLANNQYMVNVTECLENTTIDSRTTCNGGNALFLYEDLLECPESVTDYSLVIDSCVFALGTSILGGTLPELLISRGTGIGIALSQTSYGVDVHLNGVLAYGNIGLAGANVYIAIYETVDNSTVFLESINSTQGNNILPPRSARVGIVEATSAGLHIDYGISRPLAAAFPPPVCTSTLKYRSDIVVVRNSEFSTNNALAGTGIYMLLQFSLPVASPFVARLTFENCIVYNNTGVTGVGMYITESSSFSTEARSNVVLRNVSFTENGYVRSLRNIIDTNLYSVIQIVSHTNVTFVDCVFAQGQGSAISAFESNTVFRGNATFVDNTAFNGVALALQNAYMYLSVPAYLNFTNNYAVHTGGAIYVIGRDDLIHACFFQIEDLAVSRNPDVGLLFDGNFAEEAGSAVFGGSINACTLTAKSSYSGADSGVVFDIIAVITNEEESTSSISSEAHLACICEANVPVCDKRIFTGDDSYSVFPGQSFQVPLVVIGQRNGITPAIMLAFFDNSSTPAKFRDLELTQQVDKYCTNLTYTIQSPNPSENIIFLPQGPRIGSNTAITLNVTILPCPLGFQLSEGVCECDSLLQRHNLSCNLQDQTVHRPGGSWVNASFHNGVYGGVILHESCPYDYCLSDDTDVSLEQPDEQCSFDRTGVLCGGCSEELSNVLGTSQCLPCSNNYLAQLIYFAAAGALLVVLLFLLNLTVTMGTLGGLVFYANIVRVNQSTFFPSRQTNVLTVFIAWLNLDLGIEVCFYDGMDAYAKTWLQFVFPFYIWVIVLLIILISRRFYWVSRLTRSKAVPVLATLILLSYTKLLRTVITALSSTVIELPDDSVKLVWSYDGNIDYLSGKHIPLYVVALLVLVALLVPYTLLLLLTPIPLVQSLTNCRVLSWVNKLKPFLDAHQSQYKDAFRNWTGVLLLMRVLLSLFESINITDNANVNLLVIVASMFIILGFAWGAFPFFMCRRGEGGVYRKWPLSILDCSFFINLGSLAASTLYVRASGGNQSVAIYLSVGVAFLTFVGIILFHIAVILKDSPFIQEHILAHLHRRHAADIDSELGDKSIKPSVAPTTTYVELREPLLEDAR